MLGVHDVDNEGNHNTLGYTNWKDNEPNNGSLGFIKLFEEDAVVMDKNGRWNDVSTTLHRTKCQACSNNPFKVKEENPIVAIIGGVVGLFVFGLIC